MKNIFLYAYDRVNLGDDLFVHTICNRYPNVKFYLWSKKYNKKVFKGIKNLKVLDKDSKKLNFLSKIHPSLYPRYKAYMEKKCYAVVYIGGSIFIEYENWKQILTWWDYEALNRKFYILGANFGPYKSEDYKKGLANVLKNVDDICFRDKYSYDLFSDIEKVRYAPDILFNYKFPDVKSKKQIFISVIDCVGRNSELEKLSNKDSDYKRLISKYISDYVNMNYSVVISSFCKIENDEDTVNEILKQVNDTIKYNVQVINYNGTNVNEIISAIAESELIIASRFHAAILGFAANRPVLPVIYSDKTVNILKDLSFDGKHIDIRKIDENSYIQPLDINYNVQIIKNIDEVKKKSNLHFRKLDMLLEN